MFQRFLVPLFTFVWWNRLKEEARGYGYYPDRSTVVKVKGWRTAIIDSPGLGRCTSTFILSRRLDNAKKRWKRSKGIREERW